MDSICPFPKGGRGVLKDVQTRNPPRSPSLKEGCTVCFIYGQALRRLSFAQTSNSNERKGGVMKELVLQLFVIGALVATYALPVLAMGGGGP